MKKAQELTGLSTANEAPERATASALPPLSADWIDDDLLRETRELWSEAYGRLITLDEAVEILMNVKRLAEALLNAVNEGSDG